MGDEEVSDDATWLLEPPAAGEVHFSFEIGAGVELSSEGRQALETLLHELHGREVSGFTVGDWICPTQGICTSYSCSLDNCRPVTRKPCASDYRCRIADFG